MICDERRLAWNPWTRLKVSLRRDLIQICFCLGIVGLIVGHTAYYAWAVKFLSSVDLQSRGDLSGAIFLETPKHLFVGKETTRDELIAFLKKIDFIDSEDATQKGSYRRLGRNGLRIIARFNFFPSITVTFRNGRVARIQELQSGSNQNDVELEPEMLATFVETIKGENNTKRFLARRRIVHAQGLMESDLVYALMASEDATFMKHHGIRYLHLLLALFQDRGGSSMSMQAVKNAIAVDSSHTILRKLNELYLTVALEQRFSKSQILELYLNHTFLGTVEGEFSLYGYLAAAEEYFGKEDLKALTLNEACVLAGMTDGPSRYLERIRLGDYNRIVQRRDRVIKLLHKNWPERYPQAVVDAVCAEPINFIFKSQSAAPRSLDEISKAFVNFTDGQPELVSLTKLPAAEYSGLKVFTSVDGDLMKSGLKALSELSAIERQFPAVDNRTGAPARDHLLGAIVALDPSTGQIITMVGASAGQEGLDYAKLAVNATAPPASMIKPLFVPNALTSPRLVNGRRYNASTIVDPHLGMVAGWTPGMGVGEPARVRRCLSRSDDGCAAYTLNLIGLQTGAELYRSVTGAKLTSPSGLLAIGFGAETEISPLGAARAYSLFTNEGTPVVPTAIYKVYQNETEVTLPRVPTGPPMVDPGAAFITAQMLRSPLGWGYDGSVGTARNVPFARTFLRAHPEIEIGAKTGSGPNNVWMVSVGPRLVVAVLVTYQNNSKFRNAREVLAANTAGAIWSEFMHGVVRSRPDLLGGHWAQPSSVHAEAIDPQRGCLSRHGIQEYFLETNVPPPCARP